MNNAISVLPGSHNIQGVYERLLQSKSADFICLSTLYEAVLGEWYDKKFATRLFASNIKTREIVAESPDNRAYGKQKDGVKNQVRYLNDKAETDLILADNFAAIVSFNPQHPQVVVIEDESIASSARVWFEAIWASAAR